MRIGILFIAFLGCVIQAFSLPGFVRNQGQWDGEFLYQAEIASGYVFLEKSSILFHLIDSRAVHEHHIGKGDHSGFPVIHHHAFRIKFKGANTQCETQTEYPLEHKLNYFLGKDKSRWKSDLSAWRQVTYRNIYDGIDLVVYVNGTSFKYEFIVQPGVDPSVIEMEFEGSDYLELDEAGNLIIGTSIEEVVEEKPISFQEKRDSEESVDTEFKLDGNTLRYHFPFGYRANKVLRIDPTLIFSTLSGSSSNNFGYTATFDNDGHLFSGSTSFGNQYPTVTGSWDTSYNGGEVDVAITKFNLGGTAAVYSTYLGGSNTEMPHSMITDEDGRLYVFGTTGSDDFPMLNNSYDDSFNGGSALAFPQGLGISFSDGADIFITALTPGGNGIYGSTYLGGSETDGLNTFGALRYNYADEARGEILIGPDEDIFIVSCTRSEDYPVVNGGFSTGFNGPQDGVVTRFNPQLTSIVWSGYLSGNGGDAIYGLDIASDSTVYVAGGTTSNNFPVTNNAFDNGFNGGRSDAFLTRIANDGSSILQSTYFGTNTYDQAYFVKIDRDGNPHIFGQTQHNASQLIFNAGYFDVGGGQFITQFQPELNALNWSTQFGSDPGSPNISPTAFLVDVCNSVYLSGWGGAVNDLQGLNNNAGSVQGLDVTNDAFQSNTDFTGSDFYLMVMEADASSLIYGSFYGGSLSQEHVDGGTSRFDRTGKIYQAVCAGCGGVSDFPIKPDPGAFSESNNSSCNLGVFKMDFELPVIIAEFDAPTFGCAPFQVDYNNTSVTQSSSTFQWIFSDGTTSTQVSPSKIYLNSGTYQTMLVINDPLSCNLTDTFFHEIVIKKDTDYVLPPIPACIGDTVTLGPDPEGYDRNIDVTWSPSQSLDNGDILNPMVSLTSPQSFTMIIDYGGCQEIATQFVDVDTFPVRADDDTIICSYTNQLFIEATSFGEADIYEWSLTSDFSEIIDNDSILEAGNWTKGLNKYYVRATKDSTGCQNVDSILITVSDFDLELSPDTFICMRDSFRIQAISRNPKNTFNYFWTGRPISNTDTFGGGLLTDTTDNFLVVSPMEDEDYHVLTVSKKVEDCFVRDSIFIEVSSLDPERVNASASKYEAYFFESVELYGEPLIQAPFTAVWEPARTLSDPEGNTTDAVISESTTFDWTVSDTEYPDCVFSDTTRVELFEIICRDPNIFVPDAFTPNGDGENDLLRVRGQYVDSLEFGVYNRWGERVFYSENQSEGWDGTYKGELVEPAVYVYQLTAFCVDGARYYTKGNVTVIR